MTLMDAVRTYADLKCWMEDRAGFIAKLEKDIADLEASRPDYSTIAKEALRSVEDKARKMASADMHGFMPGTKVQMNGKADNTYILTKRGSIGRIMEYIGDDDYMVRFTKITGTDDDNGQRDFKIHMDCMEIIEHPAPKYAARWKDKDIKRIYSKENYAAFIEELLTCPIYENIRKGSRVRIRDDLELPLPMRGEIGTLLDDFEKEDGKSVASARVEFKDGTVRDYGKAYIELAQAPKTDDQQKDIIMQLCRAAEDKYGLRQYQESVRNLIREIEPSLKAYMIAFDEAYGLFVSGMKVAEGVKELLAEAYV